MQQTRQALSENFGPLAYTDSCVQGGGERGFYSAPWGSGETREAAGRTSQSTRTVRKGDPGDSRRAAMATESSLKLGGDTVHTRLAQLVSQHSYCLVDRDHKQTHSAWSDLHLYTDSFISPSNVPNNSNPYPCLFYCIEKIVHIVYGMIVHST